MIIDYSDLINLFSNHFIEVLLVDLNCSRPVGNECGFSSRNRPIGNDCGFANTSFSINAGVNLC